MYKKKKTSTTASSTKEEEEESSTTVWLGVQGKEIKNTDDDQEATDAYTSKTGGWPVREL